MKKVIEWAGRLVLTAGIVFALGFGAQQAIGSSSRMDDCQPCYTQQECNDCCMQQSEECGTCIIIPANACFCHPC